MRISSVLIFIILLHREGHSQQSKIQWRGGTQMTRLIRHSPNFKIKPKGLGVIVDLALYKRVDGSKDWHHELKFPGFGMNMKYLYLGEPQKNLGNAVGITSFLELNISQKKRYSTQFLIGTGLAYNNRIYNIVDNNLQNAISTHWNNITCFEYKFSRPISNKYTLYLGLGMTHISNGSYKAPNLGLNYFSVLMGMSHNNFNVLKRDSLSTIFQKQFIIGINYGYAIREHELSGGPKFAVQNMNLELGYKYKKYKVIKIGLDGEHHSFSSYVIAHDLKAENIKSAFNAGLRFHLFAGHEWYIGPISLETRLGYQFRRNAVWAGAPIYSKLIFQYHIPVKFISGLSFATGVSLKAIWADAEYMNLIAGLRYILK